MRKKRLKHARYPRDRDSAKCGAMVFHRFDACVNWAFVNCPDCLALKRPDGTPEERFFRKVNKHTLSGCWEWTGSKNDYGYGQMKFDTVKVIYAHRFSYEIHKGPIPEGAVLMHSCDRPSCVNPDHLTPGTQKDNSMDAVRKGRLVGSDRRLTPVEVERIVAMSRAGESKIGIARTLGVQVKTVRKIVGTLHTREDNGEKNGRI